MLYMEILNFSIPAACNVLFKSTLVDDAFQPVEKDCFTTFEYLGAM